MLDNEKSLFLLGLWMFLHYTIVSQYRGVIVLEPLYEHYACVHV